MKFKIDENLPIEATDILSAAGYDAASVLDEQLGGKSDDEIARICQEEGRIVITLDLDFADIRTYPPKEYAGLIALRLKQQDKLTVLAVLRRLIKALEEEIVTNKLWIVDEHRIRVRE